MVHTNHLLKHNWLQKKPVKHWYQSHGSDYGGKPKPIHTRHDQEGVTRGYLLRETPHRLLSWNNRKKSLSPGCKKMLLEKVKEIEAFNASRVSAKARDHGEGSSRSLKEKRARCYICKIRGHVYWKCPDKEKKAHEESYTDDDGLEYVITEHNKFLEKYFKSIEPNDEESFVKGLEDLKWDKDDEQDYVDEEYISWNGSLYALKVNSLSRFLSFMSLLKKDSLVYKNWEIFSKKYIEMLKWFYLVYLNYERLDEIPPRVGMMEINLLSLHKIIDNLGGYLCVTLGDKWKTVAGLQGLTEDDGEAMRDCYKRFIDMVQVYYETAERPWYERKPGNEVGKSSSIPTKVEDPQGKDKDKAGIEEAQEALEEGMNFETQFGVRLEGNREEDAEQGSITDSNDFEVII
ncbi:ARID DNA-binding domain-containing protein [Tanacetum coccineum]